VISSEIPVAAHDHEISIVNVLRVVRAHKYLVAAVAAICTALALYYAITAVPIYEADVTVAPVRNTALNSASLLSNQFGGLASLAGLNLPGSDQDRERQAILESHYLISEFIRRNQLLPVLLAHVKVPPSLWRGVAKFHSSVLEITEDKLKGLTTISIYWTDPEIAAKWANGLVALANDLVRTRALENSGRSVEYLNKQIAKTNVLELQRVMYDLVEDQTKTLMLANAQDEYAFTVVDPAVPPEERISPKRKLIVASGLIIGLILGSALALMRNFFARGTVKLRP
jgi:uncharacterized protein involved in exopolysaccharide biosynthesis